MDKRFRMISLLSEAFQIELEEALLRDAEYEKIFRQDFAEENRYLMEKVTQNIERLVEKRNQKKAESPPETPDKPEPIKAVKDIYRSLAKKTHPDSTGEDTGEEFSKIQKAYSENDVPVLIEAANRHRVEVQLTDADLDFLKRSVEEKKREIKKLSETVRWSWALSKKDQETRTRVIISMGIKPDEFQSWQESHQED